MFAVEVYAAVRQFVFIEGHSRREVLPDVLDGVDMRDNWLSNRVFTSYDDILDHCCEAWNTNSGDLEGSGRSVMLFGTLSCWDGFFPCSVV